MSEDIEIEFDAAEYDADLMRALAMLVEACESGQRRVLTVMKTREGTRRLAFGKKVAAGPDPASLDAVLEEHRL